MTIEEALVTKYGPLMSVTALSSVLDRSPESVRVFLRSNGESAQRLNLAKVRPPTSSAASGGSSGTPGSHPASPAPTGSSIAADVAKQVP